MQTDWGGEYERLNSFFQRVGISHRVSCPHAHQQNGVAERKHRHIVEVGLSLLANASMPLKFLDEAFLTATHLINLLPSKVVNYKTPTELLFHETPDYSSLECLDVHVGQILGRSILESSSFVQRSVPSLAIVLFTKALSV
jgi:histone deacetylase 1/2